MSISLTERCFRPNRAVSLALLGLLGVGVFPGPSLGQEMGSWADSAYAALRADLQQVISNQKAYFQAHDRYGSDLGLLGCDTSPGVTVVIGVEDGGFSAVAVHQALGPDFGCSVYVGEMNPAALPAQPADPGIIACTKGAPEAALSEVVDVMAEPVFIPHDVPPDMKETRRFLETLERMYPRYLKDNWIEGTAQVTLFVCDQGTVRKAVLAATSGNDQLDKVALRVAKTAIFEPALKDGDPVGVWVSMPLTFRVRH